MIRSPTLTSALIGMFGSSSVSALLPQRRHFEVLEQELPIGVYELDVDANFVYVQLTKADNFYQLPIVVIAIKDVSGGKIATVDVFSDANHTNRVYQGLNVILATGTPYATKLAVGQKTFILGLFSVNLRNAIDLSSGATKTSPADIKDALEFFAFGRPLNPAVKNGKCATDTESDD